MVPRTSVQILSIFSNLLNEKLFLFEKPDLKEDHFDRTKLNFFKYF